MKPKLKRHATVGVHGGRHWFTLGLLLVGMAVLLGRALQLQVLDNERLQAEGQARQLRTLAVKPIRGRILDRQSEVLAISTPVDSIWADPSILHSTATDLSSLAETLDVSAGQIQKLIQRHAEKRFVYLRRHLPPVEARRVMALQVPGIFTQREYHRYYPAGPNTGHLLGFTDIDDHGQEGTERAFERHLSGVEGSKRVLRDARRRIVADVESVKPVFHGQDLILSIDLRLQTATRRHLAAAVQEHGAAGGSAVMLDARTGEVLAMVNLPDYNPNDRSEITADRFRNRAVTDLFEPGSTVKPFTMSLALASGAFTPDSLVETSPGYFRIGGWTIHDIRNFGELTLSRVLIKSSNIGTAKIAMEMAPEELYRVFRDVGFGRITGVELPGEQIGRLPNRERWRPSEHAALAYGYGISVTPLQLARAYSVLAADGMLLPVSIRKQEQRPVGERVLPADVVTEINAMLEKVVSPEGTARHAAVPAYRVAGKTGTVRKIAPEGGYLEDSYQSLFAGFAPASQPRFVLVVLVDEPTPERYYGGEVAAPVFAKIMAEALRFYGVPKDAVDSTKQVVYRREEPDFGA